MAVEGRYELICMELGGADLTELIKRTPGAAYADFGDDGIYRIITPTDSSEGLYKEEGNFVLMTSTITDREFKYLFTKAVVEGNKITMDVELLGTRMVFEKKDPAAEAAAAAAEEDELREITEWFISAPTGGAPLGKYVMESAEMEGSDVTGMVREMAAEGGPSLELLGDGGYKLRFAAGEGGAMEGTFKTDGQIFMLGMIEGNEAYVAAIGSIQGGKITVFMKDMDNITMVFAKSG